MRRDDGAYACDRCRNRIEAFGTLHGLVVISVDGDTGQVVERIFCYLYGCRQVVLDSMLQFPAAATYPNCNRCGVDLEGRSVATGILGADLDPTTQRQRAFTFCHVNGCSGVFDVQAGANVPLAPVTPPQGA